MARSGHPRSPPSCQQMTQSGHSTSEFGGDGDVEGSALERILGIELLIVLADERQRVSRIAERVSEDGADAIDAGFKIAESRPGAAVSGGLDHGIGAHPHAPPAEILVTLPSRLRISPDV